MWLADKKHQLPCRRQEEQDQEVMLPVQESEAEAMERSLKERVIGLQALEETEVHPTCAVESL